MYQPNSWLKWAGTQHLITEGRLAKIFGQHNTAVKVDPYLIKANTEII